MRSWLGYCCLIAMSAGAVVAEELPTVFQTDFEAEGAAKNWRPFDPLQWKLSKTDQGTVYSQFEKKSKFQPPHRSPFNVSLLADVVVGDFVFDAKVRSTHEDYGHRDAVVVFGYQDPAHMYYVHLGKKTDDHANQIFIVNGAPRTKISTKTTPGTNWDDAWHHVRITRDVATGEIAIYFDDLKNPIMTAQDKTFAWGQFGVGTFDDTSDWDDIVIRGQQVKKPTP